MKKLDARRAGALAAAALATALVAALLVAPVAEAAPDTVEPLVSTAKNGGAANSSAPTPSGTRRRTAPPDRRRGPARRRGVSRASASAAVETAACGYTTRMDTTIAFVRPPVEERGTEIVVNFGLLSGREATLAEVDRLARRLCAALPEVRVHAVRTHDMTAASESVVHQVVVEAGAVSGGFETLRAVCETWASECAEERSLDPLGG